MTCASTPRSASQRQPEGPGRLVVAFEAVVIGGLGSSRGTLVGGIAIGLAQSVGAAIGPQWQLLAGHVPFLAALSIRPRGRLPGGVTP